MAEVMSAEDLVRLCQSGYEQFCEDAKDRIIGDRGHQLT